MSGFPGLTGKDIIKALGKAGFKVARIKGSHHRLEHRDGRKTTVPVHGNENLGPGLINKILRDVDLDRESLRDLL